VLPDVVVTAVCDVDEHRLEPTVERIVGDDEAARRAVPEYLAPWKFPSEYLKA